MMKNEARNKMQTMVTMSFLIAIVVVLQALGTTIRVGMFSLTFVLVPIVVGAILYGPGAGAILGAAFGIIVTINSVTGADPGGFPMFNARPILTVIVCMAKGILAGYIAGLVHKLFAKKNYLATVLAAVVCPVVNTGIFLLFLCTCYQEILTQWAGGVSAMYYVLVGIVAANFLPEVLLNGLLSPAIVRIVKHRKK